MQRLIWVYTVCLDLLFRKFSLQISSAKIGTIEPVDDFKKTADSAANGIDSDQTLRTRCGVLSGSTLFA